MHQISIVLNKTQMFFFFFDSENNACDSYIKITQTIDSICLVWFRMSFRCVLNKYIFDSFAVSVSHMTHTVGEPVNINLLVSVFVLMINNDCEC